jgi:hypothetical protein
MNALPHIIDGLVNKGITKQKFEMALAKMDIDKSVIVTQASAEEGE